MKVEALLDQLKKERICAIVNAGIYRSKARNMVLRGDRDVAMAHWDTFQENQKQADLLDILITDIEKRVS